MLLTVVIHDNTNVCIPMITMLSCFSCGSNAAVRVYCDAETNGVEKFPHSNNSVFLSLVDMFIVHTLSPETVSFFIPTTLVNNNLL